MNELPKIGLGTWQLHGKELQASIKAALYSGYRHIDTAQVYNNEFTIGQILEQLRFPGVFITSKVWSLNYRLHTYKSIQESVRRLRVDKINLMLMHAPLRDERFNDMVTAYKEMMRARADGLIDFIGVSNFPPRVIEKLKEAVGEYPYVNQIILTPTVVLEDIEKYCKERGIKLTAYSTLSSYFRPLEFYKGSPMNEQQKARINQLAKKYHKDAGQILSKWALQCGYCIIPKSSKPLRVTSNIQIDDFELTNEEVQELRSWNIYSTETMYKFFSTRLENKRISYEELTKRGLLFDKHYSKDQWPVD